jgi:hypothetical protein
MSFDEVKTAASALSTAERLNLLLLLGDSLRKPLGAGGKKKRAPKQPLEEGAVPKPPSDWQTGLAAVRMVLKTRGISPKVPLVTQMGKALKDTASWPNPSEAEVMAAHETVSEARSVASAKSDDGGAAAAGAAPKMETVEKVVEKKKERVEKMKKSKGDEAAAAAGGGGAAAAAEEPAAKPKKAATKKAAAEEIDYDNIEEAKPWTHGKTSYLRQFNYLWTNDGVWVGAWDGKKIDKTAKEPAAEME